MIAAFFDVDGTITTGTTLFRFLDYWLAANGHPPQAYPEERRRLREMTAAGVPRTVTNRAHYERYAGEDAARIDALAEEWYEAELRAGSFYQPSVVDVLEAHRGAGHLIALVSGSFPAPLGPIVRHLRPDWVVCTEPEVVDGRYTGGVRVPMVGPAKADAMRDWAAGRGVSLPDSWAYGDHPSDLPMLEVVGRRCVVGEDPVMLPLARREGWDVLPALAEPPLLVLDQVRAAPR